MTDGHNIADVVRRNAGAHPRRIALQDATGSRRVTYGELWSRIERGAARLHLCGLAPGDRVLLLLPAGPDWIPAFLAIVHAGLVAVPIPVDTPDDRVRLAAAFTAARVWIGDTHDRQRTGALAHLSALTVDELEHPREPMALAGVDPTATAVLVFTSGSTSHPRAVALSHHNLRANLRALFAARQAAANEAMLSTLPPSHAYELVAGQLAPLAAGARIVYAGVPLPNRLIETMRTQNITRATLVPALFEALARDVIAGLASSGHLPSECRDWPAHELAARYRRLGDGARARLRAAIRGRIGVSLRALVIGGAATNPAWTDVLRGVEIDLDVGYGLTEAGPVVAMGRARECPAASCGRPLQGVEVRIGADGEVLVHSEAIMQGYAGDPCATAAALQDGWLRTGDRGRLDANGFLFITGRIKEAMVTSSGETIYPDEVEPHFASPLFAEWAVVPAPGADGNDRPTLVVVPATPGMAAASIKQEAAALNAAVPARLRVAGVIVRTTPLPRTAVGKVRRRAIASELTAAGVSS